MKKVIRKNVFETNSSSTHSICVCEIGDLNSSIELEPNGDLYLGGGEFGWEIMTYTDARTKANYLALYVKNYYPVPEFEKMLVEVLKEQTGCNEVIFEKSKDGYYGDGTTPPEDGMSGYIDHQSVEDQNYHHLFSDKENVRRFIFNPKSILRTDNDNH